MRERRLQDGRTTSPDFHFRHTSSVSKSGRNVAGAWYFSVHKVSPSIVSPFTSCRSYPSWCAQVSNAKNFRPGAIPMCSTMSKFGSNLDDLIKRTWFDCSLKACGLTDVSVEDSGNNSLGTVSRTVLYDTLIGAGWVWILMTGSFCTSCLAGSLVAIR